MRNESAAPGRGTRLRLAIERDGDACVWCGRPFSRLVPPTTDHLVPRVKGGPSWLENELAACRRCNRERGHTPPAAWLEECERRGWRPHRAAVVAALRALESAVEQRGGQRRARPYLDGQLRRLAS